MTTPELRDPMLSSDGEPRVDKPPWQGLIDLFVVCTLVPIFWFPLNLRLLAAVSLPLLPAFWIHRLHVRGGLRLPRRARGPLLLLLASVVVSCAPVTDWDAAVHRLLGVVLGVALILALAEALITPQRFYLLHAGLAVGTATLSALALFQLRDVTSKEVPFSLPSLVLPSILPKVPGTPSGIINPNEIAGALVLLLPLVFANATLVSERSIVAVGSGRLSIRMSIGAGIVGTVGLISSRSRSADLSVILLVAISAIAWSVNRIVTGGRGTGFPKMGIAGTLLIGGVGLLVCGLTLAQWFQAQSAGAELDTFTSRKEIWNRALYMIQDFPLTGIGLGQFNTAFHVSYAPSVLPPETIVPHAHNVWLDFATQLGLSGAVAFFLILVAFFAECRTAMHSRCVAWRRSAIGAMLGMIAFLVYGLTDSVAPGARGELVLWAIIGFGLALGRLARASQESAPGPRVILPHTGGSGWLRAGFQFAAVPLFFLVLIPVAALNALNVLSLRGIAAPAWLSGWTLTWPVPSQARAYGWQAATVGDWTQAEAWDQRAGASDVVATSRLAQLLFSRGDARSATGLLAVVGSDTAIVRWAQQELQRGNTAELVDGLSGLDLSRVRDRAAVEFILGEAYLSRGQPEEAKSAFSMAWQDNRSDPWPAIRLTELALSTGDTVEARRIIETAVSYAPGHSWARLTLSRVLLTQNEYASALEIVAPLLDSADVNENVFYYVAIARLGLGERDDAARGLCRGLEVFPKSALLLGELDTIDSSMEQRCVSSPNA